MPHEHIPHQSGGNEHHDYFSGTYTERLAKHNQQIVGLEAEIAEEKARIDAMEEGRTFFGKIGAAVISGKPKSGKLDQLEADLRHLKGKPEFSDNETTH